MLYSLLILVGLTVLAMGAFYLVVARPAGSAQPSVADEPSPAAKRTASKVAEKPVARSAPPLPEAGAGGAYAAVSVSGGSCAAAWELEGRRFLTKDAPRLPLSGCDADNCSCKYVHHRDRRENQEDRRSPRGLQSDLYASTGDNKERRSRRGRRKEDFS